jgi:hypothetical protein
LFILESPSYKDVSPNGLFPKKRIVRRPLENLRVGICRAGIYFPPSEVFGEGKWSVRPATMNSPSPW